MQLQVKRFNKTETYVSHNHPDLSDTDNKFRQIKNIHNSKFLYCQLKHNKRLPVGSIILNGHFSDLDKLGIVLGAHATFKGIVVRGVGNHNYSITEFRNAPNVVSMVKSTKRLFDCRNEKFQVRMITDDYEINLNNVVPVFDSPHGVELRLNHGLFGMLANTITNRGIKATVTKYQIDDKLSA